MKSVALRGDYQAVYMTDRIRQAASQTDRQTDTELCDQDKHLEKTFLKD